LESTLYTFRLAEAGNVAHRPNSTSDDVDDVQMMIKRPSSGCKSRFFPFRLGTVAIDFKSLWALVVGRLREFGPWLRGGCGEVAGRLRDGRYWMLVGPWLRGTVAIDLTIGCFTVFFPGSEFLGSKLVKRCPDREALALLGPQ
jgi:hypothetical protein